MTTHIGNTPENHDLSYLGLKNISAALWNLSPAELVEETILAGQGQLTSTGALAVDTGEFTGRSPKDKFIVADATTKDTIWWGGQFNLPFDPEKFDRLHARMCAYVNGKDLYVRDLFACADDRYREVSDVRSRWGSVVRLPLDARIGGLFDEVYWAISHPKASL